MLEIKEILDTHHKPEFPRSLWETLVDFSTQLVSEEARLKLNSEVSVPGRFVERASGASRKTKSVKKVVVEDETAESDIYVRPNGDKYHARTWGTFQDVSALRKAREATRKYVVEKVGSPMFALLYGAPGTGKTALVEASFANQTGEVYTLMGTGDTEVSDLIGGYVQTPSGGFSWVDGDLVKAAETGGVYFVDEIGLIDPKVLSVLYGLMDGRREIKITANPERGTVKADPNFFVVAATNPNAPGVRLSEALLSRFTLQAEMTTDWDLARKLGVPTTLVTASQNLYKKQVSGETSWSPQMRELLAFRDITKEFGTDFAISNLLASAPEIDRPVVSDVLSRVFGDEYRPAKI
jgi:midasin (ATPase involved in ribosome maturation)